MSAAATGARRLTTLLAVLLLVALGLSVVLLSQCRSPQPAEPPAAPPAPAAEGAESYVAVWWNVENLFDTVDGPAADEDFTPAGKQAWSEARLALKLDALAGALRRMPAAPGRELPDLLGLAEVENRDVVERLLTAAGAGGWQIAHWESPDERGIDVAVAWDPQRLSLVQAQRLPVVLPGDRTRDVVAVQLAAGSDRLHVIAAHWPSRRSPDPARRAAARVVRGAVEAALATDPAADVLLLGDLNDEPGDPSVADELGAVTDRAAVAAGDALLFDLWADSQVPGTYVYRDDWNRLDHAAVSRGLLDDVGFRLAADGFTVVTDPALLRDGEPYRTYSYGQYAGGPADHLPLAVRLLRQ